MTPWLEAALPRMINDHTNKLECARWLLKKFDGIVYLVTESDEKNTKLPDFIWDGRLWDLKTPVSCGKRTIDNQFKKIHKRIGNNPGGIIIVCSFTDLDPEYILEAVFKRMVLCKLEGDVIIRKKILLSTKKKIEWIAALLLGGTFYLYFYYSIY